MRIILSSAYNAPIQYYTKFLLGKSVVIEQHDTFIKQSYRNRCVINATDGAMSLSVPVKYSAQERTKTKEVEIASHGNWQHTHWNALVSAYNSSPFFEYYRDDYQRFYTAEYASLAQFNDELLRLTLSHLNIDNTFFTYSDSYIASENILDYRETIHPKKGWESDTLFQSKSYYQLFNEKRPFSGNMSILDLLFNMGNESLLVLHDCIASTK